MGCRGKWVGMVLLPDETVRREKAEGRTFVVLSEEVTGRAAGLTVS